MSKNSTRPNIFPLILLFLSIANTIFIILAFSPIRFTPCANSISCKRGLDLEIDNNSIGIFVDQKIVPPKIDPNELNDYVLGQTDSSAEKVIYVNLTTQTLSAYEGDNLFLETPISSGRWGRTPTGEFKIWTKLRSTRMTGGSGSDYYDLPNVEYTMFYYNDQVAASRGYSLHGAYWHNNFGYPMSHGCVNMRNIDAKKIYEWIDPPSNGQPSSTRVIVYEDEDKKN